MEHSQKLAPFMQTEEPQKNLKTMCNQTKHEDVVDADFEVVDEEDKTSK